MDVNDKAVTDSLVAGEMPCPSDIGVKFPKRIAANKRRAEYNSRTVASVAAKMFDNKGIEDSIAERVSTLANDLEKMANDEFDGDIDAAVMELTIRIGGLKNLQSYSDCLVIQGRRKNKLDELVTEGGYTLEPDRNVIRDPGKFEGEHVMTLYFYDAFLNGDGEQYGDENDLKFNVSDDEAEAFDIAKGAQVILCFSEQGFVSSYIKGQVK